MLVMWEEKVDRDWSMDCSSPMSARTAEHTLTVDPSAAGICRPHWAMRVSKPRVLRVTVLPPVLGPVITRVSNLPPRARSLRTAVLGSSRGWRARLSSMRSPSTGSMAPMAEDSLARAKMQSKDTRVW